MVKEGPFFLSGCRFAIFWSEILSSMNQLVLFKGGNEVA